MATSHRTYQRSGARLRRRLLAARGRRGRGLLLVLSTRGPQPLDRPRAARGPRADAPRSSGPRSRRRSRPRATRRATIATLVVFNTRTRASRSRSSTPAPSTLTTRRQQRDAGRPRDRRRSRRRRRAGHASIHVRIGDWPSGLYFARLDAADGRVGFAPFVVRPRRLGEHRVAVVLPTMTWQAYNLRDDNGDGKGDTWYAELEGPHRPPRPPVPRPRRARTTSAATTCRSCTGSPGRAAQVDFLSDGDLDGVRERDRHSRAPTT